MYFIPLSNSGFAEPYKGITPVAERQDGFPFPAVNDQSIKDLSGLHRAFLHIRQFMSHNAVFLCFSFGRHSHIFFISLPIIIELVRVYLSYQALMISSLLATMNLRIFGRSSSGIFRSTSEIG